MGCRPPVIEANVLGGTLLQAQGADSVGFDPVYRIDRVPMGAAAKRLSAHHNGAVPFLPNARQRPARCHQLGAGGMGAVSEGRTPAPTAGVIDSQSVEITETGGPRGYDAGKKIKRRKRHVVTDTLVNMLEGMVHGADVQDRDGAPA